MRTLNRLSFGVALATLAAGCLVTRPLNAQSPAVIGVSADDTCGGRTAAASLGSAIQDRLPDAMVMTDPPANVDLAVRVAWTGPAPCRAHLDAGETSATLDLPADADAATLDEAASRVAWLADVVADTPVDTPVDAPADDASSDSPTLAGDPLTAPPAAPVVPVGLSVIPGINAPGDADETAIRRLSFTLFGSRTYGLDGFEFGLLWNHETHDVRGLQLAGVLNLVEGDVRAAQVSAGVNWVRGELRGVQFASGLNVAGDVRGVQWSGGVNVADHVRGAQFGVVNVAKTSTASIGLLNIMTEEPVYGLAWFDSDGFLRAGIQHGSDYFRTTLFAGATPAGSTRRWTAGGGFVGRIPIRDAYIELDLLASAIGVIGDTPTITVVDAGDEATVTVDRIDALAQARITAGYAFGRVAVFGGIAQNALFTQSEQHDLPWDSASPIDLGGNEPSYAFLWPSFYAGVRF